MADDSWAAWLGEGQCTEIGVRSAPSQPRSRFGVRYPRKLQTPPFLTPSPTGPSIHSMSPAFTRHFDYIESKIDYWDELPASLQDSRNLASPSPNTDELDPPKPKRAWHTGAGVCFPLPSHGPPRTSSSAVTCALCTFRRTRVGCYRARMEFPAPNGHRSALPLEIVSLRTGNCLG